MVWPTAEAIANYVTAVRLGDLNAVKRFHRTVPVQPLDAELFWTAIYHDRRDIARYLFNELRKIGVDPFDDPEAVRQEWIEAISNEIYPQVELMLQYAQPPADLVPLIRQRWPQL